MLTDRAMYAYSASPDDPNEVSFAKGDMLDVIDGTGKWFQVRAPNGQTGVSLFCTVHTRR
jgi:SHO1 osmosensor